MELKFKSIQDDKPIIKDILLSEEHSTAVFDARKKLLLILKMEELFDQIIESHLTFKKELYASALMISGYSRPSHIVTHEIRSKLNRIVFNTLNLSKLYLDKHHYEYKDKNTSKIQTTKCFAMEVTNIEDIQSRVKTHKNEVSKDNEKYKLGCSLRNIAQHSTLPIGEFDKDMNTINGNDGLTVNIHFNLPIEKKQLKRKVPACLLAKFNDRIDLHEVMDGYVYGISQMHQLNRKLIETTTIEAVNVFKDLYKSVALEHGKDTDNINVDVYEDNERLYSLELDWFDVVAYLQQKHAFIINHRNVRHSTYIPE